MSPKLLTIEPLTAQNFADFGDVIEAKETQAFYINDGQAQRFHDLAEIDVNTAGGHTLVSLVRSAPTSFPLIVSKLERHPLGSQAFMPLGHYPFVIVVALTTEHDLPATPRAFLSNGQQGINYRAGVWHHALIVLQQPTDFLVIDRGGSGENCDVAVLTESFIIQGYESQVEGQAESPPE